MAFLFAMFLLALSQNQGYWVVEQSLAPPAPSIIYTKGAGQGTLLCRIEVVRELPGKPGVHVLLSLVDLVRWPKNQTEWEAQSTTLLDGKVVGKDNRIFLDRCALAIPTLPDEVKNLALNYFNLH